jgi:Ca2+-transporting ATPase
LVAVGEFLLALLCTQMDALQRLLDTTPLDTQQFAISLIPVIGLFALWEIGKLLLRRSAAEPVPSAAIPAPRGA